MKRSIPERTIYAWRLIDQFSNHCIQEMLCMKGEIGRFGGSHVYSQTEKKLKTEQAVKFLFKIRYQQGIFNNTSF